MFLESILSARDVLSISYVGQSVRENTEIPPSVLVSELLDAIQRGFGTPGGEDVAGRLVIRHRLQGFNPIYFSGESRLFSYSAENFRALAGRERKRSFDRPFLDEPLGEPSDELKTVTLDRLVRFYVNPAAFFLEQRLQMRLGAVVQPLQEREPFEVGGLDGYLIRQELLEHVLAGGDPHDLLPVMRSRGLLPPALHGERVFMELLGEVREFARKLIEHNGIIETLEPLEADLELGGFRLFARLDRLTASRQLFYRCATMKESDRIRTWITHLVLVAVAGASHPTETYLFMRDRSLRYPSVEDPKAHLEKLLFYYWQGQSAPLPFLPNSSVAWCEKSDKGEDAALEAVMKVWNDGYGGWPGEGSDPAVRRCFGDEPPLGDLFRTIASDLIRPMLDHGGRV